MDSTLSFLWKQEARCVSIEVSISDCTPNQTAEQAEHSNSSTTSSFLNRRLCHALDAQRIREICAPQGPDQNACTPSSTSRSPRPKAVQVYPKEQKKWPIRPGRHTRCGHAPVTALPLPEGARLPDGARGRYRFFNCGTTSRPRSSSERMVSAWGRAPACASSKSAPKPRRSCI